MASKCGSESRFDCCAISAGALMIFDQTYSFIIFVMLSKNICSYSPLILMLKPGSLMQKNRLSDTMSLLE